MICSNRANASPSCPTGVGSGKSATSVLTSSKAPLGLLLFFFGDLRSTGCNTDSCFQATWGGHNTNLQTLRPRLTRFCTRLTWQVLLQDLVRSPPHVRVVVAGACVREHISTGSLNAFGMVFVELPYLRREIEPTLLRCQIARVCENLGHIELRCRVH